MPNDSNADQHPSLSIVHSNGHDKALRSTDGEPTSAVVRLERAMNIPAEVKVVLGSTTMRFGEIAKLGPGATVGLDQSIGEPLDLMVNGHLIARGEGVVVDDGATPRFGISITEIRGLLITPIR